MKSLVIGALVGLVVAVLFRRFFVNKADTGEVQALLDSGAVLVDVRSPGEFSGGTLSGAKNIPMGSPPSGLDKSVPIVVFCASGMRSAKVAKDWRSQGFSVTNLGPMSAGSGLKL